MVGTLGWFVAGLGVLVGAIAWIPRELWRRLRTRLVDRIERALGQWVSRFPRHYREYVLSSLRFIDHKGLATVGFFTPELDDVFVDVSLAYRSPHDVPHSVVARFPAEITERLSISEFLDRPDPVVLAVVGVPGSGKTTLLRYTARRICEDSRDRLRTVPILLYLRDHVADIVADPQVELPTLVRGTLGALDRGEPAGWFDERLRAGDCVVLLDGLDEVAKQESRQAVANWVERQTRQYARSDFVITSRPHGYSTTPVTGAIVLQVRNFTSDQVTKFVHGWYLATERHSTGVSDDDVALRARTNAEDLMSRLANAPALADLTVNPLLLTMIANVHRYRGALPGSRVDLYGEICQVMLWRRQEAKQLHSELSGERKEGLLRTIAFMMMERRLRDVPKETVLAALTPVLRRMSTSVTGEDFLTDVSNNGLLVEREAGQYIFAHLTFQEYLAAMHVRDKGMVDVLADTVDEAWWRETTLLYVARSDADPIVAACLKSGTIAALALAFDVAEDGDLEPDLRRRLEAVLDATDGDAARRRLRAGVHVTRFLRHNLIRTATIGQTFSKPITTEIYNLFRADTGHPGPDGPDTAPHEPIAGVRASDALAFVNWINEVTRWDPGYRLINSGEIEDPAIERSLAPHQDLCVWVHDHGEAQLWVPLGNQHPQAVTPEMLAQAVRRDIMRSASTLSQVVLLNSLIRALDLSPTLTRDLALALDLDRDHAHERARFLAPDLDLAKSLERAHSIEGYLSLDRSRDRAVATTYVHSYLRDIAVDLDRVHDRSNVLALAPNLARERSRALANALVLDHALDRALTLSLDRSRAFDPDQIAADVLGHALTRALQRVLYQQGDKAGDWLAKFSTVFIKETNVELATQFIDFDGLADGIDPPEPRSEPNRALSPWADEVIRRLKESAGPILGRQNPITASAATAIRIADLCVSADADTLDLTYYSDVSAGITLLERRANGQSPATETIILATA